jgi:hypothetical protein
MKYIVYKITNIINQKYYIGIHKTDNINDGYMGSGKLIKKSLKKHGRGNFHKDILYVFDTLIEAQEKEKEIVDIDFIMRNDTYNISIGGGSGGPDINGLTFLNKKHSAETKDKIRQSLLGKSYLTEEGKSKIIFNNKNNQVRNNKISNSLKGKPSNNKKGINGSNTGKTKKGYKTGKRKFPQIWITDEKNNTRIKIEDEIPNGWRRGRTIK